MSTTITSGRDIPPAPYYVLATDTFLSGWGEAEGTDNRMIFPCRSLEEANVVQENAEARTDMKNIKLCSEKPVLDKGTCWSLMDRKDAARWYEPGGFSRSA